MSSGPPLHRRSKVIWLLLGAVGLGAILTAAMITTLGYQAWRYDWFGELGIIGAHSYLIAEYDDMEFEWATDIARPDHYDVFSTGSSTRTKGPIAPIYLRAKETGNLYYLPDFSMDDYLSITGRDRSNVFESEIDGELWCEIGDKLRFQNGKLSSITLHAANAFDPWQFEIGPSKTGEFVTLPAPRETVHRVFGLPLRYKRHTGGGM